jgi:hypothetical protein
VKAQTSTPFISPAEETISLGPLTIRFLLTGENSSGSVAMFELTVPGEQRLMARRTVMTATRRPSTVSKG